MPSKTSKPSSDAGLQGIHAPALPSLVAGLQPAPQATPHQIPRAGASNASNAPSEHTGGFLLQIENVMSCPVYVQALRRDNTLAVTDDQAKAKVFSNQDANTLAAVTAEVTSWPLKPGPVCYVRAGIQ